jgi:hypothetical protein
MTNKSSTSNTENPRVYGGMTIAWLLGDEPKAITTKTGDVRTVIELRDPKRLSNSITIWLDGDAKAFELVSPGVAIALHVEGLRAGKGRGELVATVERAVVEEAFRRARA